jgi:periplasmic protein TonB
MLSSFLPITFPRISCALAGLVLLLLSGPTTKAQLPSDAAPLAQTTALGEAAEFPTTPDSLALNRAPQFPGGDVALLRFISGRIHYPALASRNRVEGKVIVSFWVDERGHTYGFGILKGLGAGLDEEAIRVLKEMPDWEPALTDGQPTLTQLRIPVNFRLAP